MSFLETGVLEIRDIETPPDARFEKGPVAVIECVQRIPCNPCVDACPQGAITMEPTLNDLPQVNFDQCNGCGICLANCPGLAIFLIDKSFEPKRTLVGLPYEFNPLPEKGELVTLLNRAGESCGQGEVIRVRNAKVQDRTPIVFIGMDPELPMQVRFFRRESQDG